MRTPGRFYVALIFFAASLSMDRSARAAWPNQPTVNVAVCRAAGDQTGPQAISDGAGGAIVVWDDLRSNPGGDVYTQHLLASGTVDPLWPTDGRGVRVSSTGAVSQQLVSDGAGGAIVVWSDARSGVSQDIYAQHVRADGTLDPAWPVSGLAVCTAAGDQLSPLLVSDGQGGAIVAWADLRVPASDIYAQRVLATGTVDPAWPANGLAVCTAAGAQNGVQMASDGQSGAVIGWTDSRSGASDIYVSRVLVNGTIAPGWTAGGLAVCTAANSQTLTSAASDGAGGAFLVWSDQRSTGGSAYIHHVLGNGSLDPWTSNGVLVSGSDTIFNAKVVSDGAGGALVAWANISGINAVRVQHIVSGVSDPAWPGAGLLLSSGSPVAIVQGLVLVSDLAGGVIAAWGDTRLGVEHIFGSHALTSGVVDPAWASGGTVICEAPNLQKDATIAGDGSGGAIVAWGDTRNITTYDIYAQRIEFFGHLGDPEPAITAVQDVALDQGGQVKLSWNGSYLDPPPYDKINSYWVLRSVPTTMADAAIAQGARLLARGDAAPAPGQHAFVRVPASYSASATAWEYVASEPALHLPSYSYLATTTGDSVAAGIPWTQFMILALNTGGTQWWFSAPDSGYSVDNLPPAVPTPFHGAYAAGTEHLHWGANGEPDFFDYRLYRGSSPGFIPGPSTLVSAQTDTGYTDAIGNAASTYKLSAVDIHGNESAFAVLTPSGITSVDPARVATFALAAPSPDPMRGASMLRFSLPVAGAASLVVCDVAGRRVVELVDGRFDAGEHAIAWDGNDDRGHALGSGVYFAELISGDGRLVRRFAILR